MTDKKTLPDFVKYGKIPSLAEPEDILSYKDREFEVFEKVDGGNCQVRVYNWQLFPGTKSNFLKGDIINTWPWFQKFVKWTYSNESLYNLPESLVLFGEWSGNHTIEYSSEYTDRFVVLDVFDTLTGRFLRYSDAIDVLNLAKIKDVVFLRTLANGFLRPSDIERLLLEEPSDFYDGPREGLVLKDYSSEPPLFLKIHHPDFAEKRKVLDEKKGRTRKGNVDYLTPNRFRKSIYKILEEEQRRDFSYTDLVEHVRRDVLEEEGFELDYDVVERRLRDYLNAGKLASVLNNFDISSKG